MTARRLMEVVELDPAKAGIRSRVKRLWKVEDGKPGGVHYVFDETPKYPIYCLEHGTSCGAVREILSQETRTNKPKREQ